MLRLAVCLAAILMSLATRAFAAPRPELKAWADEDTVAVGDTVDVILEAMSAGAAPGDPQLGAVGAAFSVHGSSSSPSTSISIINGVRSDRRGLTTTWRLRAEKVGKFRIGPPSIDVGGVRFRATPIDITVVERGRMVPRSRAPQPFDPFQGLFDFGHGNPFAPPTEPEEPVDSRFALDAARDQGAFLHATVDKTSAVVGEQVTFSVYVYVDASLRDPDFTDVHEAPASDFVRHSLREDDSQMKPLGTASVGGRPWTVRLIRKSALFPLRAGDLEIGPMSLALANGRGKLPGASARTSETLTVHVNEPAAAGRPPGYALGDVGTFQLAAQVDPRLVERGGAIGVTIDLSGTGNLPGTITPPQRQGVEWLEPQVRNKLGVSVSGDDFGGTRSFAFVVRLQQEGDVDLGEVTLPYWNPKTRAYAVARAPLGRVHVTPGKGPLAAAEAPPDALPGLPALRATRAAARPAIRPLTDSPFTWLALGAPTLAYAGFAAARDGIRRARARREREGVSPRTEMKHRLAAVDQAISSKDAGAIDGAVARALEAGALAYAGVNVRGVGTGEVTARLVAAGVDEESAAEVRALLAELESSRFSAGADDASSTSSALARWKRAKRALARMERT